MRIFNPAQPQPWRTIVGVVPDTLMQGPFNQQTDSAGFYVPLLGVPPSPQFVHHRRAAASRAKRANVWRRRLAKRSPQLDSNLPTYFAGTPARLHDEILGVNRLTAKLFTIFGIVAVLLVGGRSLRRDEFLGQSADAGVRHSHGAGRGCDDEFCAWS